jgi:hypothetical protein
LKGKTPVYKYLYHNLLVHRKDPLLWFHLMQANVQLIYPNFIVQEISFFILSLLQLLITQIQWQMIFFKKYILQGYYIHFPQHARLEF